MDQVIIEFVADTKGLKLAADQLLALGKISKEQHAEFSKTNQEAEKQLKARAIFEKEISKATQQATNDAKKMNDSFRQLTATIAGEVIKETVQSFQELGRETEEVAKKFNSAKQELKALTAQINNGELEGEALTTAKIRAAELTDQIGDTRDEIRALASDTRTFDLMVEGVRGITAAMSLAQGATALFGEENEDVQKALLKVQAAMAVATATQELATIATTKGGLAQTAYSLVVGTSTGALKAFRIALAGTGIGLAVVAVAALVENWDKLTAAVREYLGLQPQLTKEQVQEGIKRFESIKKIYSDEIELERSKGNDTKALELRRLNDLRNYLNDFSNQYKSSNEFYKFQMQERQDMMVKQNSLEKALNDQRKEDAIRAEEERIKRFEELRKSETDKTVEPVEAFRLPDPPKVAKEVKELMQTVEEVVMEKVPTVDLPVNIQPMDAEDIATQLDLEFKKAAPIINDFANTINSVFGSISEIAAGQTSARIEELNKQREAELANKNLTEEQKEAIDKKYRDKENAIKRKAAEQEKGLKLFMATVNTAVGVTNAYTSGDPYTAPLRAALAAASGLAQIAVIAAQPIPQFAKGGKNIPEGMALVGEKGPELMWIPQGASIIPNAETREILDKWGVPSMPSVPPNYAGDNGNGKVAFDYSKLGDVISDRLQRNPHLSISIDKNGFATHLISKNKKVQYLNARYEY